MNAASDTTRAKLTRTLASLDAKIARLEDVKRRVVEALDKQIEEAKRQARAERASHAARALWAKRKAA